MFSPVSLAVVDFLTFHNCEVSHVSVQIEDGGVPRRERFVCRVFSGGNVVFTVRLDTATEASVFSSRIQHPPIPAAGMAAR